MNFSKNTCRIKPLNDSRREGLPLVTPPTLQIAAASRLHFGLLSFGNPRVPAYGGVGLMVDRPVLRLRIEPAATFRAVGPLAERVDQFARHWQRHTGKESLPGGCLQVLSAPRPHVGLGVGTQLGLCVAALLYGVSTSDSAVRMPPVKTLAQSVGRGRRSSIGTLGFAHGGLLFERGTQDGQTLAALADRVELCPAWRIVLLRPCRGIGLWGEAENRAFQQLPAVPASVTEQLISEVQDSMLPAARANDCEAFGESIYRYGVRGGCASRHSRAARLLIPSWRSGSPRSEAGGFQAWDRVPGVPRYSRCCPARRTRRNW